MSSIRQMLGPGIVAIFDSVNHDSAAEKLEYLLFEPLPGIDAIVERQQLLRSIMKTTFFHQPLYLHKTELNEVRTFLDGTGKGDSVFTQDSMTRLFSRNRTAIVYELGRLQQLIIFFKRIRNHYFKSFTPEAIGTSFREEWLFMEAFLRSLEIDRLDGLITAGNFGFQAGRAFYRLLSEKVSGNEVALFFEYYAVFEAFLSIARSGFQLGFQFPQFTEDAALELNGFYHPLLKNPVANDLRFLQNVIVLTGPNMSGKSTVLKALGICLLLAHQGLPIPVKGARISCFDHIFCSVNTSDDLSKGYSQFYAEIRILKEALETAGSGRRCFCVFDELFRGTNGEEAAGLLTDTLSGLRRFTNSLFVISTHLTQIRRQLDSAGISVQAKQIISRMENDQPVFTYQLTEGWSELKLGAIIFKNSGLDTLLGGRI